MTVPLTVTCIGVLLAALIVKYARDRRELKRHTITPEALHTLLASDRDLLVIDVRHPLDLLGESVTIPGAEWFAPKSILDDPSLIPAGRNLVVYCTCPSDNTSRAILHRALAMGFSRIKFLKGGLEGWRAKGYPVEPYKKPFRLGSDQDNRLTAMG
jgi:rhodanese-related sulfurtransferase